MAIIGHGSLPDPNQTNEHTLLLLRNPPAQVAAVRASTLASELDQLKEHQMTIALHPCFSGGFLQKLGRTYPKRVIVISTAAHQGNDFGWIESLTAALSIRGRTRGRTIKEAWEQTKQEAANWSKLYNTQLEEPQIDNAEVAEQRYLGDNGLPLNFTNDALERLRELNAKLHLACR